MSGGGGYEGDSGVVCGVEVVGGVVGMDEGFVLCLGD